MARLDPNTIYEEGQLIYFNALPPTRYNPDYHTIQGAEFYTADPIKPLYGALVSAVNPWSVPSAVYMKEYRSVTPTNINGVTVPSGSTEFSAVCKAWWQAIQGAVDGTDVLEAKFPTYDTLVDLNGIGDTYYGYDIHCTPVWFADYYNPDYPKWGIRIDCVGDFIEPSGGGDFISIDLRDSTERNYRIVAVVFDTLNRTETTIRSRKVFWCIIDSSNKVIKSIAWRGGVFYDSQSDIDRDDEREDDTMTIPDLPNADFLKTGLARAYCFDGSSSSIHALNCLSDYLWSGNFDAVVDSLIASPIDSIIALNQLPSWEDYIKGSTVNLKIGRMTVPDGTGVAQATSLSREWYSVDCGTISIPASHGNYLDYEPYTSIDLFLPYVGSVKLSPKDVVGKTIHIVYHIDSLTGQCCCFIADNLNDGHIMYMFNGNCLTQFPITGSNFSRVLQGAVGLIGDVASLGKGSKYTSSNLGIAYEATQTGMGMFESDVAHSGAIACTAGELGVRKPYAIITTRTPIVDANYNTYAGQPYFKTAKLSSVSGFTIVEQVQINGIIATQGELDEIERLLKEGVIL